MAKEIAAAAVLQSASVSLQRRKAERPLAEARIAQTLAVLGENTMAVEMLERAWSNTSGLGEGNYTEKAKKAKVLLAIAEAAHRAGMSKNRSVGTRR
jgi:hypothetical protein